MSSCLWHQNLCWNNLVVVWAVVSKMHYLANTEKRFIKRLRHGFNPNQKCHYCTILRRHAPWQPSFQGCGFWCHRPIWEEVCQEKILWRRFFFMESLFDFERQRHDVHFHEQLFICLPKTQLWSSFIQCNLLCRTFSKISHLVGFVQQLSRFADELRHFMWHNHLDTIFNVSINVVVVFDPEGALIWRVMHCWRLLCLHQANTNGQVKTDASAALKLPPPSLGSSVKLASPLHGFCWSSSVSVSSSFSASGGGTKSSSSSPSPSSLSFPGSVGGGQLEFTAILFSLGSVKTSGGEQKQSQKDANKQKKMTHGNHFSCDCDVEPSSWERNVEQCIWTSHPAHSWFPLATCSCQSDEHSCHLGGIWWAHWICWCPLVWTSFFAIFLVQIEKRSVMHHAVVEWWAHLVSFLSCSGLSGASKAIIVKKKLLLICWQFPTSFGAVSSILEQVFDVFQGALASCGSLDGKCVGHLDGTGHSWMSQDKSKTCLATF